VRGPVVVIVEHGEDLAFAGKPGGLSVGKALSRFGKGEAELAQALDESSVSRSDGLDRVRKGL